MTAQFITKCLRWRYSFLPVFSSFLAGSGIIFCYSQAVQRGHVLPLPKWTSISDGGAYPPESSYFTFIVFWSALLFVIVSYYYYKYVENICGCLKINKFAFTLSIFSSFGLTLIACFQRKHADGIHLTGSLSAFIGGNIYAWTIVYINIKHLPRKLKNYKLTIARVCISSLQSIVLIIFSILFLFADHNLSFYYTLMGALEWTVGYCVLFFVLLFFCELNSIVSVKTTVKLKAVDRSEIEELNEVPLL